MLPISFAAVAAVWILLSWTVTRGFMRGIFEIVAVFCLVSSMFVLDWSWMK